MSWRTDAPSPTTTPHSTAGQVAELLGEVAAERAHLSADAATLEARRAEFFALADVHQAKLRAGWDELNAHAAGLQSPAEERDALRGEVVELRDEIARLDARATNARAALRQLELDVPVATLIPAEAVSLAVPADPGQFLAEVAERDHELRREQSYVARARGELERRAATVFDDRLVVAEHVTTLAVAQERWRRAEWEAVGELERIAGDLTRREDVLADREAGQADEDAARLVRAQDLWRLHLRLEAWQSTLAVREVTLAAGRDALQSEVVAKRGHLERWEQSLADVGRKWAATRKHELWQLRAELDHWADSRNRHRLAFADVEDLGRRLRTDIEQVGAKALALVGAPGADDRRTRVLQKKWERHFHRFARSLDARRAALDAVTSAADDRLKLLTQTTVRTAEQHDEFARERDAATADLVRRGHDLDARATVQSLLDTDAAGREAELAALRGELERLMTVWAATPAPVTPREEIVALVAAGS